MPPLLRSTWPALFRLAWPGSLTGLLRIAMRTTDLLVVGIVIGASGVAAIGIADSAARLVVVVALGIAAGTAATVSQRHGAGDRAGADAAATQTALLAVALGLVATVLGVVGTDAFFAMLGAEGTVASDGAAYLRLVLLVSVPRVLAVMLDRAFQSVGDARTPMYVRAIGTGVNVILTVGLVGGMGGLPALGVLGAAVGTAVGETLSGMLMVALLASRRYERIGFSREGLRDLATGWRILTIGAPQVLERSLYALAAIPLNGIVLTFGTAANAGYNVGRRILLLGVIPNRGISIGASTLVGNHAGRRDLDASARYGQGAIAMSATVSLVTSTVLLVFAEPIAALFTSADQTATAAVVPWVRAFALAIPFRGLFAVLRGAMQGSGETRYPLYASAVGVLGVLLGGAWLFAVVAGLGLAAMYVVVVADPIARVVLLGRWWRNGAWRRGPDAVGATATS